MRFLKAKELSLALDNPSSYGDEGGRGGRFLKNE
jgi:hypothetical protein